MIKFIVFSNVISIIVLVNVFISVRSFIKIKPEMLFIKYLVSLLIMVNIIMVLGYYNIHISTGLADFRNIMLMLTTIITSVYLYCKYKNK